MRFATCLVSLMVGGEASLLSPKFAINGQSADLLEAVVEVLNSANSDGVFEYTDSSGNKVPSTLYTWAGMTQAVRDTAVTGIGNSTLWVGEGNNHVYGLVNIAAFLAQCMSETIVVNACDENNWSGQSVVDAVNGTKYSAASSCGQYGQSYQNYRCGAEDNELAGGQMECDVDPEMTIRAVTQAYWGGAPARVFCAPKSKVPKTPRWDNFAPASCNAEVDVPFPDDVDLDTYFAYVNNAGTCKDYTGQRGGGWTFDNCSEDGCENAPAPNYGHPDGRTDVEGCCWWGRGPIQTSGVCNYGKLNFYMGKRAADEGRDSIYPQVDFCKTPDLICDPNGPAGLRWSVGFFYWLYQVQPYDTRGWKYMDELTKWVDAGMDTDDMSFLDGASGVVNRGCHDAPACGSGELHGREHRQESFKKVLEAMGVVDTTTPMPDDRALLCLPGLFFWGLLGFSLTANALL